ncbi:MAG: hypothetical protein V4581_01150 [Bacteroidota bacterium]
MKPNAEQQQFIVKRLRDTLTVRETYNEVYDHILCALEEMPDEIPFDAAMQQIWEHDLGGKKGIRAMQTRYNRAMVKEFISNYFFYFLQTLKSYYLLLVALLTIGFYALVKNEQFAADRAMLLSLMCVAATAIILRITNNAPKWQRPKLDFAIVHIKASAMAVMIMMPQLLWLPLTALCRHLDKKGIIEWLPRLHRGVPLNSLTINIATAFFFLMLLHAVTYYKLYKNTQAKAIAI